MAGAASLERISYAGLGRGDEKAWKRQGSHEAHLRRAILC